MGMEADMINGCGGYKNGRYTIRVLGKYETKPPHTVSHQVNTNPQISREWEDSCSTDTSSAYMQPGGAHFHDHTGTLTQDF